MEKICPAKVVLYQAVNNGESDVFGEHTTMQINPIEKIDIYCDIERCAGPEPMERHRLSLFRLFGSTQYEVCPIVETAVDLKA